MNDTKKYFHFTIGPVQDFVAQARRTRDFWAGSFILSWLAGVAIQSVRKQGGTVDFPKPDENFMSFLIVEQDEDSKKREGEGEYKNKLPKQGSIPNRFKATIPANNEEKPVKFDASKVVEDVRDAWKALAEKVWENDLESLCNEKYAHIKKKIWNDQIGNFWEISWVLTMDKDASDLLDRRKNLRTHQPPSQKGVKCMVMDGWQELSGGEKDFWQELSSRLGTMELREDEHLCAIAFVKRRFHDVFEKLTFSNERIKLTGWKVHSSVPSSYYIAAVHWLENLLLNKEVNKQLVKELLDSAEELGFGESEFKTEIYCLTEEVCKGKELNADAKKLVGCDGNIFFEHDLLVNFPTEKRKDKLSEHKAHLDNLKAIYEIASNKPSPFYAVLLMDGDSLGEKMSTPENQEPISTALDKFTKSVPDIVYENNGFLIYAGGDDVLAILPLEDVLKCTVELRKSYQGCFKETKNEALENSTISAAIEFVHVKTPLRIVLKDAHSLLDKIAKEKTGRDAVAVRVWKGSGRALEWAMPFEYALENGQFIIEKLANDFRDKKTSKEAEFSSKFFYKIRARFELLNPEQDSTSVFDKDSATRLLTADYLNSGVNREKPENQKLSFEEAKVRVGELLEQCRHVVRNKDEKDKEKWHVDAALLIRFLAQYWQTTIENKDNPQ
ncbi:MAG: hypothetical protein RL368_91 [Pseudomonadota bacterium]|jgi:CRISPR-associated protein Cmr2